MSRYDDEYEDDDFDYEDDKPQRQEPADLRKAYNKKKREFADLQKEVGKLQEQVRDAHVANVVRDRGLNPAIAEFVPPTIEPTKEAITAWIESKAEVFNTAVATPPPSGDGQAEGAGGQPAIPGQPPAPGFYTPQEVQAQNVLAQVAAQQSAPALTGNADIAARMRAAGSEEELDSLMAQAGFGIKPEVSLTS